jgi:ABC-type multidrug transport system fused ATPase/permease subunit
MSIFFILFVAGVQIVFAFILQELLDTATQGTTGELRKIIIFTLAFLILSALAFSGKFYYVNRYLKRAITQYKNDIFSKIFNKNINSFNEESEAAYISGFTNDLKVIEGNYLEGRLNIILQLSTLIGGLAAMFYINWIVTMCILIVSSLPILVSSLFGKKIMQNEQNVSLHNANFIELVKDLLSGFITIKSFNVESKIIKVFEKKNDELEQKKRQKRNVEGTVQLLASITSTLVEVTVFGVGVYFAIIGKISVGAVVAFIQLLNYVLGPITTLGPMLAGFKAAESLIVKNQANAEKSSDDLEGKKTVLDFQNMIEFRNVTYDYEEGKSGIRNISYFFESGYSYAIVGASGSGKTTMLNMFLSYHDDYEGEIFIDETEYRELNKSSLYNLISVVQQNVFMFDTKILDNITLFNEIQIDDVNKAVEMAGLTNLIIEKGYDYPCGVNGNRLSGGEKQRIAIARSLLRKSPILLIDEGTSSLDQSTARLVEETIHKIEGVTKIVVTHKLDPEILNLYDKILVMHNGSIVEEGSLDTLLERKGYFFSLFSVTNILSTEKVEIQ